MQTNARRIIIWDPNKPGSRLGEPFQLGMTYGEWKKSQETKKEEKR